MDNNLITINDDKMGTGLYEIEFIGTWMQDKGYGDRFVGGDEHWTTANHFGTNLPSFIFRFTGTQVALYGHKVPAGAMAEVYIDNELVGEIDYYSPDRIEKTLLFKTKELENTYHELRVLLVDRRNPQADNTQEASLDYIEVLAPKKDFFVDGILAFDKSLFLEEGMEFTLKYEFTPFYANVFPKVNFTSNDDSVAKVDTKGKIFALKEGNAAITLQPDGVNASAIVKLTVAKKKEDLAGFVADSTTRDNIADYFNVLEEHYDNTQSSFKDTCFLQDKVNSRILIYTKAKEVKGIKVSATDFTNENGKVLSKDNIDIKFMSSVRAHDTGLFIEDVVYGGESIDLKPYSLRSIWVSINTPIDLEAGTYIGNINVTGEDNISLSFDYSIEVLNLKQPEPENNQVQLEVWMYPYSSNRYYSGKSTPEYFGESITNLRYIYLDDKYLPGLKSQVELYAKSGGKAITVTVVEDPWNSQTPDPYPSMVKWTENEDGSLSFDYTDFDKWVQLNLDHGVNGQIKTFSISSWTNIITYLSKDGTVKVETLQTGTDRWKYVWTQFLEDYMRHTTKKGWFDMVYMAMDERPLEEIRATLDLVESVKNEEGKSFKTSMAVYEFKALGEFDRLDDISFAYQLEPETVTNLAKKRREKGLLTTVYTCGPQNSALCNPPYEGYYSILYTYKLKTDGFLRWALDSFNKDPLRDSTHRLFASGDIFLIYPDESDRKEMQAKTSQRYEQISAGIRDVAKVKYLKEIAPSYADRLDSIVQSLGTQNNGDMFKEAKRVRQEIMDCARDIKK